MTAPVTQDNCTLLPCPFCGPGQSQVDLWFDDVAKRYRVGCGRCGCSTGIDPRDKTEAPAIANWNKRATPPADMEGAVEAAAKAVKLEWTVMCQELGRDFPISSISPTNFRLLRAALTAALPALQRTEWRPMTTAPRDGTDFLAYLRDPPAGDQMVIFYDKPSADAPNHCWHRADGLAYHRDLPKFWQPLPAAPVLADDRSAKS